MPMKWIHTRDFDLMTKTMDEEMTASKLINDLAAKMKDDPIFSDFIEDGNEGEKFIYFDEDTEGLDEDEKTERCDELLASLYDYADGERIAL